MTAKRPTLYFIEYTDRPKWEELHRVPGEPADREDFRGYLDVRTLREARKEAKRLLDEWPFAQPIIFRRISVVAVQWDYGSVAVDEDEDEETA